MSYTKQNFTSGQTLKAEHLNHMEDGIEAIANNVQIKKIVFTDRPTLWNWLTENDNFFNVWYVMVKMGAKYPWPIKMQLGTWGNASEGWLQEFHLTQVNAKKFDDGFSFRPSLIEIDDTEVRIYQDPEIKWDDAEVVNTMQHNSTQTLPDQYWSAMGVEVAIYYFAE